MLWDFSKVLILQRSIIKYLLRGVLLPLTAIYSYSCGTSASTNGGEIVGEKTAYEWANDLPRGMVLIPSGTFLMGSGVNQGIIGKFNVVEEKTITAFYIDETEVTNAKYRQFIAIVRANPDYYGLTEQYINERLIPDMSVWKRDFDHGFMGDTLIETYYEDPRFDDYPVVGVTWEAAKEYARVRSIYRNDYLKSQGKLPAPSFRLPTAAEYEYAAKGGQANAQYPWGGPAVRDAQGRLLANFQATAGDYAASGYTYTAPVKAFMPNNYGLYDMAGNVSEWCDDDYSPLLVRKSAAINPVYRSSPGDSFKVMKGGSWKDFAYALQTGVLDCEHKDMTRSYIGFRCVMSAS